MKKVLIVTNPSAGRKKAVKYRKSLTKYLLKKGIYYDAISAENLNAVFFRNIDTVIVIGGDGTVSKIMPYIMDTEIYLYIIPCGTANLLAAKLGIPTNINKAIDILDEQNTKQIDILRVNRKKYSILRLGLGYDSDIICKTPQSLKNKFGYFAYFIAGILFALRLKQRKYNILLDGEKKLSVIATCIIIANAGNMFKNIFSISSNCFLDDGLIDVFILKVKNPVTFFIEFLQIIFNIRNSSSKAMYLKTSKVSIKSGIQLGHIDGEKEKFKGDIDIDITPRALNVFCAK